jgi:hypothetical protein
MKIGGLTQFWVHVVDDGYKNKCRNWRRSKRPWRWFGEFSSGVSNTSDAACCAYQNDQKSAKLRKKTTCDKKFRKFSLSAKRVSTPEAKGDFYGRDASEATMYGEPGGLIDGPLSYPSEWRQHFYSDRM